MNAPCRDQPRSSRSWSISNVFLFMPGLWEVAIEADDGTTHDQAKFSFCIAG